MHTSFMNKKREFLSQDKMFKLAPSIFTDRPSEKVSSAYAFIPTTRVLGLLENEGWKPVNVSQSRSRTEEGREFTKHMIRLSRDLDSLTKVGDSSLELILTNAHNGLAAFNLMLGLFRQVCSNGLVVKDNDLMNESIKHIGFQDQNVIEATYRILENGPKVHEKVDKFSSIQLSFEERNLFAAAAHKIKYEGEEKPIIKAGDLLLPRRWEDKKADLWTTFNNVQENMIRGGLRGSRSETGRRRSTKEVKSINENIKLNAALWHLTEEMAKLKMGA
jgi:hypothetical protein